MSDKKGKSVMKFNKETTKFFSCSAKANLSKISYRRTSPRNVALREKTKHSLQNAGEPSRRSRLGTRIDKKPNLQDNLRTRSSSSKVGPQGKLCLPLPNSAEYSRKRKIAKEKSMVQTGGGYAVVSKWLDFYEEEATDEEIQPLVNKRSIRNKRMKILRECIKREKEEMESKLKESMEGKLSCSLQDNVLVISDDDSS